MLTLYKFQEEYLTKVKPNWIYDVDTGLGKTIMALEHHKKFYRNYPVLIVAPASKLLENGWQRTIEEHYSYINYETCSYNMLHKKYLNYKNYFVIFDEVHRLKNSTGVWGKAGYNLTKIAVGFVGLSATPIPNGWIDAINYFKMFHLTKNKTQFIRSNAITSIENGYMEIKAWKNENKLLNMWKSFSKRLSKEDCIDLPDLSFINVYFEPSKVYSTILKKRIYKDTLYDNAMKLRHGLRLNANLKDKIEYLKDFIEDTTDNIVIFYNYNEELELLKNITKKTIYVCNGPEKNYPQKNEWENIKNTVTLANYKSGSEAVEFTYANLIIYFSPTDSYTEFYQSYGRCYRVGQNKKVIVYKFITKNTIEENIYDSLNQKQDFNYEIWEKEKL